MPQYTQNHGLSTPVKGTNDWSAPLNENFESLDVAVAVRDSVARRTKYDPLTGAWFIATDTGALYHGDGTDWVYQGGFAKPVELDQTADGATSTFTVTHNLYAVPAVVDFEPRNEPSSADHWVSRKHETEADVTFSTPPSDGEKIWFDVTIIPPDGKPLTTETETQ